ncbi:MAG TPA: alpha/beta fold hydrolase [Chryseolinea sp.]|nr:alpha/beta fold hydrolase [Chryseolinea sp.]
MKESVDVVARDGTSLSATWFITDAPQDIVIIIAPATGVTQEYYGEFGEWLASLGFNVYTIDYRGIGQSRPTQLRDVLADMKDWSKDLDALISHIGRIHPRSQTVILGHSVGGQLIGMSQLSRHVDAFIMIGAQTPYWKHYEGFWLRLRLFCFWRILIPVTVKLFGYFPASLFGLFEDLPANVATQWARWAKSPNYVFDELPDYKRNFEVLNQRALMISFSDDELAPARAVAHLRGYYKNLKFDNWHFQPEDVLQKRIGHFGFFKKRMQAVLWREVVSWIHKVLSAPTKKAA